MDGVGDRDQEAFQIRRPKNYQYKCDKQTMAQISGTTVASNSNPAVVKPTDAGAESDGAWHLAYGAWCLTPADCRWYLATGVCQHEVLVFGDCNLRIMCRFPLGT